MSIKYTSGYMTSDDTFFPTREAAQYHEDTLIFCNKYWDLPNDQKLLNKIGELLSPECIISWITSMTEDTCDTVIDLIKAQMDIVRLASYRKATSSDD